MTKRHLNPGVFFNLGFDGTELTAELKDFLLETSPGWVILFKRNIENPEQLSLLTTGIKSLFPESPPIISIDFEGGLVNRLNPFMPDTPSARDFYTSGRTDLIYEFGKTSGKILRYFNIDVNFAPVSELYSEINKNGIEKRAYSSDPFEVRKFNKLYLKGLLDGGVIGCLKHFPGLTETDVDSHHNLPSDKRDKSKFLLRDLYPYNPMSGIAKIVMVAHCLYPELLGTETPASLSRKAYRFLYDELRFKGMAVSDDLLMGALKEYGDIPERAAKALTAGAGSALICAEMNQAALAVQKLTASIKRNRAAFRNICRVIRDYKEIKSDIQQIQSGHKKPDDFQLLKTRMDEIHREVRKK
ncbi:MAG: glycoside hydrolase family 3 protein [Acidobacteria bacterium]|nr:glycoside hydrolase family 3 protein [Acidobacteriota bacterium]